MREADGCGTGMLCLWHGSKAQPCGGRQAAWTQSGVHGSATVSLGFSKDHPRTGGTAEVTLVFLRPCWFLRLERVEKRMSYSFCKYTHGSSPQDKGTSVTHQEEAMRRMLLSDPHCPQWEAVHPEEEEQQIPIQPKHKYILQEFRFPPLTA